MRQLILALAFGMVLFVWASGAQAQRQNFVCSVVEAGVNVLGFTQVRLTDNGGAFLACRRMAQHERSAAATTPEGTDRNLR